MRVEVQFLLFGQPRLGRLGLQDPVEAVEDARTVLLGHADDVADHGHRQQIGDVADPVAAAVGQQPADHRRGSGADALLELADGARRERARDHPAPLGHVGWVHVDEGRVRRERVHGLDERAVGRGERFGVAVDAQGMAVLGGHPEVALQELGDSRGELVVEDRLLAAEPGEQFVGKSVAPQREIRQVDGSRRRHVRSSRLLS